MAVAALLLAAGESTRMGTPKPLLPWAGETLLEYQVRELTEAGAEDIVVVLGHAADEIEPLVRKTGARAVRNERYREGRASSLRTGAEALDEPDAIVVSSVDQPRPADVVHKLIEERESRAALVVAPEYEGRRGHPVVLEGRALPDLRTASEETLGLRGVIGGHEDKTIEIGFETPIVTVDINTPDDYERAVAIAFIDRINAGDVDGLARFMTDDHELRVFDEQPVTGREENRRAWRGYASAYPDYRIHIQEIAQRDGLVSVLGHTTGSHLGLPDERESQETLIWHAEVAAGRLRTWWLIADNPASRGAYFGQVAR